MIYLLHTIESFALDPPERALRDYEDKPCLITIINRTTAPNGEQYCSFKGYQGEEVIGSIDYRYLRPDEELRLKAMLP